MKDEKFRWIMLEYVVVYVCRMGLQDFNQGCSITVVTVIYCKAL